MKKISFTIAACFIAVVIYSQNNAYYTPDPPGMVYVPMGSFEMKYVNKNDTVKKMVSVQAFYMSQEVTNREYRAYVNDVLKHPADTLYRIDWTKVPKTNPPLDTKNISKYCTGVCYADIAKDIIDTSIWQNEFNNNKEAKALYQHYFSDPAFDSYPVLGVSYKQATYYCIWKTTQINNSNKAAGKKIINDYRLPMEEEWMYVASQKQDGKTKANDNKLKVSENGKITKMDNPIDLFPAAGGKANDWGLYHLSDNVSEWVNNLNSMDPENMKTICGGSWKGNKSFNEKNLLDQNTKTNYTGFRMVQTYLGTSK
jgi:formylglycine-generating enzyme required for sulfatase activity